MQQLSWTLEENCVASLKHQTKRDKDGRMGSSKSHFDTDLVPVYLSTSGQHDQIQPEKSSLIES